MTDKRKQEPRGRKPDDADDARSKLAENWASVTASMVSPGAGEQPRPKRPTKPAPLQQPVAPEPQLAPVLKPVTPPDAVAGGPSAVAPTPQPPAPARDEPDEPDEFRESRNNLTVAVSFTIFALVTAMAMTIATQFSANTAGGGSGTLLVALAAIALAWTISIGHRLLGRYWGAWYLVPLTVLLLGPSLSGMLWQHNQEALARSYLSAGGQATMIDADTNTIASTTIYTPNGCFSILRDRNTKETSVLAASATPQTARQHADMALAPRFAARIAAGGATSTGRIFFFDNGQGPPRVDTPEQPPLDCVFSGD